MAEKKRLRKKKTRVSLKNCQKKTLLDLETIEKNIERILLFVESSYGVIDFVLVSNRRIKSLNAEFLGKNVSTDILSFRFSSEHGEVVISAEQAAINSRDYGLAVEDELLYLAVHGILHLKGYSDYNKKSRARMFARQDEIFSKVLSKDMLS